MFQFFDDPLVIANNTNGLYPQGFNTPGAVRNITFSDGEAIAQTDLDSWPFYVQVTEISRRLTLNLGLRWTLTR